MTAVRSLALTRLALLGTLSRNAGEGGPSPHGSVGEGNLGTPNPVAAPFCADGARGLGVILLREPGFPLAAATAIGGLVCPGE